LVTLVGTIVFTREYHVRLPVTLPVVAILTFLPYQIVLGASSVRAVARALRRQNNWEKTAHIGAHRVPVASPAMRLEPILHELGDLLGMEHRSLLVRDQTSDSFSIATSQGLPDHIVRSVKVGPEDGIVGWVVRERCPIIIDERPVPAGIGARLRRHDLSSSIVVPIQEDDSVIAVLTLSTREAGRVHDAKLHHLTEYLDQAIQGPATVPGLDRVTA
jgi:transcriptional regulator with GAF, ATPase, and Fis domain